MITDNVLAVIKFIQIDQVPNKHLFVSSCQFEAAYCHHLVNVITFICHTLSGFYCNTFFWRKGFKHVSAFVCLTSRKGSLISKSARNVELTQLSDFAQIQQTCFLISLFEKTAITIIFGQSLQSKIVFILDSVVLTFFLTFLLETTGKASFTL